MFNRPPCLYSRFDVIHLKYSIQSFDSKIHIDAAEQRKQRRLGDRLYASPTNKDLP
jgi:hypothetical protein